MSELKYTLSTHYNDDYSELPSHVIVTLNPQDIAWIKKARKIVKAMSAYELSQFWYGMEFKTQTADDVLEEFEGSMDTELMLVTDDAVRFSSALKHTETEIFSDSIPLKELFENWKVIRARPKTLPILMGKLEYESSKEILHKRLKGK